MKDEIINTMITIVITIIMFWAVTLPMGRSEARAILMECGDLRVSPEGMIYYMDENPLVIELEAIYILSEVYEGITIITCK